MVGIGPLNKKGLRQDPVMNSRSLAVVGIGPLNKKGLRLNRLSGNLLDRLS